jgi:hypothetical protein
MGPRRTRQALAALGLCRISTHTARRPNGGLNTWQNGDGEGGWTLTTNYKTTKYGTLTEALGAVEQKILEDR